MTSSSYATNDCTGSIVNTSTHLINFSEPLVPYGCFAARCETTSTAFPLTPNQPYSLGQYYDSGLDICVNPLVGLAQLNDACITMGPTSSSYAHYPWVAGYDLANCQGEPSSNFSVPVGCIYNPNLVGDDDDYSVIPSRVVLDLYAQQQVSCTLFFEPLFPSQLDNEHDPESMEKYVRQRMINNMQIQQESLERLSVRLESMKFETKETRVLGLWYYGDDNPDQLETLTYSYIPGNNVPSQSQSPTISPTGTPFASPTINPTVIPSTIPTPNPTAIPTLSPIAVVTNGPSLVPVQLPTVMPTVLASGVPTQSPSMMPSVAPVIAPVGSPTVVPSAISPSMEPTIAPVFGSPIPTQGPSTVSSIPPTVIPSTVSSHSPSLTPATLSPVSDIPTATPSESSGSSSSSSSSTELSHGAVVVIALGIVAIVVIAGVSIAVFFFGWTMCGFLNGSNNKHSNSDDDVQPNLEMSFDYGKKSTVSMAQSISNPIYKSKAGGSDKASEKINFDLA